MPFPISRRAALGGVVGALAAAAQARAQGWYAVRSDDGKPAQTMRLPVELLAGLDRLPGVYRMGPADADLTVYAFYDYNCPYCRTAAPELARAVAETPDLAVALVDNPLLSPGSREAAAVEFAILKSAGAPGAVAFHKAMFERAGPAGFDKALAVADGLGLPRQALADAARDPAVEAAVKQHLKLAAMLGFTLTPTYVLGSAGLFGFPGRRSFGRMVADLRRCGELLCR